MNLIALNPWHVLDPSAKADHRFYRDKDVEWLPPIDVYEDETSYKLLMDLPGFDKQNVEIQVENKLITVIGTRLPPQNIGTLKYSERIHGRFIRKFSVPKDGDENLIRASFQDGVMLITIAKQEKALPRKILIEAKN